MTAAPLLSYYKRFKNARARPLALNSFRLRWPDSKLYFDPAEVDKFRCPSCKNLMIKAMQTDCGHRMCLPCLGPNAETSRFSDKNCAECGASLRADSGEAGASPDKFSGMVHPDFAFRREFGRIVALCPNHDVCGFEGKVQEAVDHIPVCPGVKELCSHGCGELLSLDKKDSHDTTCSFRKSKCEFCEEEVMEVERMLHLVTDCTGQWRGCPFCQKKAITIREELQMHLPSCANATLPCPFYQVGCRQWMSVSEVEQHLMKDSWKHMALLNAHESSVQQVHVLPSKKQPDASAFWVSHDEDDADTAPGSQRKQLQETDASVRETRIEVRGIQKRLESLEKRIDILEVTSHTGVFIWKIDKVHQRTEEAERGEVVSLYSPPFSTSQHGYRMCMRVYLNGDGAGKGEYISLFLVLMQSDHDELLQWPFMCKVSLYLLPQESPESSVKLIRQSFMPNKDSASFKKPTSSFNLASGFPKFAHKRTLHDKSYTKNESIFFKCRVDIASIKTGPDSHH